MSVASADGKAARGGTTRVEPVTTSLAMSRLGPPSSLPRFRWQQPIPDRDTPPSRDLTAEESINAFDWGRDSILPYSVYADYDRSAQLGTMPLIRLSNGRLEADVAPQYGGRMMRLYDCRLKRDLVFRNLVFQPANLATLNAWFSGGIEWNGLIPGHTPFTCAPVFAGVLETEQGPVLRLYEFDRVVEASWQIDLFIPEDDDRLFVHGRIANEAPAAKLAYWWTNVAVPMTEGMRVISPAAYAIEHVLPGNELARFPFPDPGRFDGSYPGNWRSATSVFFREPGAARLFIAALDADGIGLAQTSTAALRGRKFFYFGEALGGQHWMDFLASPGEGKYIEIQAGIAPTQNQRFDLAPSSELHWTEVYGGLSVDRASAHAPDYAIAECAVTAAIDVRFPSDDLARIDAFLTERSRKPLTRRLAQGSPWGERQERLTGNRLAAGLNFAAEHEPDCWDELASSGAFSLDSLERVPDSIAVSEVWVAALKKSRAQGATWLHDLLLGIAALDRCSFDEARALFDSSVKARPTWLGLRQKALVAESADAREDAYLASWKMTGAPPELAIEIAEFLLSEGRFEALATFITELPAEVSAQERIAFARASLASVRGNLDELERLLRTSPATIREGEMLTVDLWRALQAGQLETQLGRKATDAELSGRLRSHPLPERLDFRMLAEE